MQSCVPTAITKSVLIAVGGTVEFATMICHGRLVGSAKKKPVDIVLNIDGVTFWDHLYINSIFVCYDCMSSE